MEGQYEHHNPDEQGHDQREYGHDSELSSTAAAIAAMESLAAQSSLQLQDQGQSGKNRSAKKELGPEAERARKDNHKEVERKRRELISNGISGLASIVPGCDAKGVNKTAVINAAVRYIQELKNNEASNIEKWTLEKLLMDQAMNDLNQQLDMCRKELQRYRSQLGIEEPEESHYTNHQHHHHHHHQQQEQHQEQHQPEDIVEHQGTNDADLDPDLDSAGQENEAASALSKVAAAAAAAAAASVDGMTGAGEDQEAEAADEARVEEAALEERPNLPPPPSLLVVVVQQQQPLRGMSPCTLQEDPSCLAV